uniref:Uncharacterized protein n=1 Tax=Oxyrrhis marina TaxID=2969 RepID=A0A7S3UKM4_OXYMA
MDAEGEEASPKHPGHETARGCSDVEPDIAAFPDFKPIPAPDVIQKVQFHEQPPMWLMFDFMTSEEIDYLLAKAEPKWERAQVHRAVIRDPAKHRSYVGGSSGKTSDVDTPFTATVGESRTAFMCVLGMSLQGCCAWRTCPDAAEQNAASSQARSDRRSNPNSSVCCHRVSS